MSELLDNRRHRLEQLKSIVQRLHEGEDVAALRREFGALLDEVGTNEIAALEDELMAEGVPEHEIRKMCDLHAALLAGGPARIPASAEIPGHPAHTVRAENARIRELADRLRAAAGQQPLAKEAAELALEPPPAAVRDAEPAATIDAGALLSEGATPVKAVLQALDECAPGAVVRVEAPFLPAPMVEALRRRGAPVWGSEGDGGSWTLWIEAPGAIG